VRGKMTPTRLRARASTPFEPAPELASEDALQPDHRANVITVLFADEYWQLKSARLGL
jgi:hypothetical protein